MYLLSVCAAIVISLQLCNANQPSFDCTGLANGDYGDRNVACSQWYWTCTNGVASQKFCNDGLSFYAANDTCIDSKAMPACIVPTNENINFDCSQRADGMYPNNASVCSQISAVSCKAGVRSLSWCWATARFDVLSQHCLFPKHMSACGGSDIILSSDSLPPLPVQSQLQFDCLKKIGNFPNPEQACSNLFVICGPSGFPSAGVCPAGTVYDVSMDWCQYPQYVTACGGHPQTTASSTSSSSVMMTTTTSASTTSASATSSILPGATQSQAPQQQFSCDGLDVGYYANPQQPCSQIYFACTGAKSGIQEQCAPGTFWDRVLMECNWHDSIPECGGSRPSTASSSSATASASASASASTTTGSVLPGATGPAPIAFNCTGLKAGNYPLPNQPCSRFFYTCTLSGQVFQQTCPINTWYSSDLDQCLFYAQVPACSGTPRASTSTSTQPPSTQQTSTMQSSTASLSSTQRAGPGATQNTDTFDCTGKQERNYLPVGVTCSSYFWECANGMAFKQQCPPSLKYDEYSDQCLMETDVIGCPNYIQRSSFCKSKPMSGVYAYPGQCSNYVFCINGIESVLTCPTGTVWNSLKNRCDQSKIVSPPCGTGPNPAPLTCVNQTPGLHASQSDCSVYIDCSASSTTVSRCSEGAAFNETLGKCVPAYQVPTCFPPAQDGLANFCADIPDGAYNFPGNCRRALFCLAKKAYVIYCTDPTMPYWDPIAHKCSPPTQSCTSTSSL